MPRRLLFQESAWTYIRFWIGAALHPYLPTPLAELGKRILNRRTVRRRALPNGIAQALAPHCAQEYANLGALLPELYGRFGPLA
ncbi:MAG: DAPG hydrolase family protein [Solirubrobacteraceae bacterium]